jgi:hypothetical protein
MKTLKQIREGRKFTDKEIKQAYGILNDPRYRQGNYSGAVKAIEKLKRGLSKHPSVANALRRANEDINEYGGPKMSKKDYHEYGKNYHKEETLHEITLPRKEFEKIKKGDVITLHFDSSMKKGHKERVKVKSKTRSNKYNVDIINMGSDTDSRNRTKFKFFSRGGKDATLAWGDMGVTLTKYVVEALEECASKDDFKPHMMYDPKTGKGVKANTYADHVKYDKMGYTHEKPEIKEDYRKLAKHGMGAETKNSIKVGTEVDYYRADGAKYMGKVIKMGPKSYIVRDDKTKKNYQFMYLDREKAKKYLKQSVNEASKVPAGTKFISSYVYKGGDGKDHKHSHYRKGNKMTDPVVVHIDGKEWKTFPSFTKAKQAAIDHIKGMKESVNEKTFSQIRERKDDYPIYHKTYSAAMAAAYAYAKKKGFEVDTDDIDRKVAMGPKKPSNGKTNSFTLKLKDQKRKMLAVQVTNLDNRRYELNTYIT